MMDTMHLDKALDDKLHELARLLAEANLRARITGPRDEATIYRELVLDCLYCVPHLEGCASFVDVGSGGGLPGIVIALCRPDMSGILLDSIAKKTNAAGEIASALGCASLKAVCARSEELASRERERYDAAVAKAVAPAAILAELLSPLVRVGGCIVALKGSSARDELSSAEGRWGELGLSSPAVHPYDHEGRSLCVVVWQKTKSCPARFPRRPGDAVHSPWYEQGRR